MREAKVDGESFTSNDLIAMAKNKINPQPSSSQISRMLGGKDYCS
jgi:hypothetical protein